MKPTIKYLLNGEYHYATVKDIGDIEKLKTTVKTDLVGAINSVMGMASAIPDDLLERLNQFDNDIDKLTNSDFNDTQLVRLQAEITAVEEAILAELESRVAVIEKKYNDKLDTVTEGYDKKVSEINTDLINVKTNIQETQTNLEDTGKKLNAVELNVTDVFTNIDDINGKLESKIDSTEFDLLESTVSKHETSINQNKKDIELKASQESLDLATGRIEDAEAGIQLNAQGITSAVKRNELRKELDGINIYGANLLRNTRDWEGWKANVPARAYLLTDTYNHLHIQEQTGSGNYLEDDVTELEVGKTYTASVWAKSSSQSAKAVLRVGSTQHEMKNKNNDVFLNTDWQRMSVSFVASSVQTEISFTVSNVENSVSTQFAGGKIETGTTHTGWQANEEDVYERVVASEAIVKQQADSITALVEKQVKIGEDVTSQRTEINQMSDKVELNATKLQEIDGEVSKQKASIELNAGNILSKVEQSDIDRTIDGISIDRRNLVLNSDFILDLHDWSNVNENFKIKETNGKKGLTISRTGLSSNMVASASSNMFAVKDGDKLSIGLDVMVSDLAKLDVKTIAVLDLYDIRDTRVAFEEFTLAKLEGVLSNGVTGRLTTRYVINRQDVAKARLRLTLYRNGSITFTNITIEKGDIKSIGWYPAPEDSQLIQANLKTMIDQNAESISLKAESDTVNKLDGRLESTEAELKIANDKITANIEKLTNVDGTLKEHSAQITATAEELSSKMTSVEVDELLNEKKFATQSELKQTADSFTTTVGTVSGKVDALDKEVKDTKYTWVMWADDINGNGISANNSGKKFMGIAYNKPTIQGSTIPSDYTWSKVVGDNGVSGVSITNIVTEYRISGSDTTVSSTGWTTTVPARALGQFLWVRERIVYSNSSEEIIGTRVVTGDKGDGGVSISAVEAQFSVSTSKTTAPTSGWVTTQPTRNEGQFLWRRDLISYSNNTTSLTTAVVVTGDKGNEGRDAQLLFLSSDVEAMTFTSENVAEPSSQRAIINAKIQNTDGNVAFTAKAYNGTTALTDTIALTGTGNSRILNISSFPSSSTHIEITATLGSLTDTVSIFKLKHGAKGTGGEAGKDALVGFLTNESITLGANSSGTVSSFATATGSFRLFEGLTNVSSNATYSVASSSGVTVSINTAGVYTVTAMSTDNATAELKAVYKGVEIIKSLTLAKSKAGATGGKGDTGGDAYTVILSNESHSFAGDETRAIANSTTVNVIAYKGSTKIASTIGTISGHVTGLTTSVSGNGTLNNTFTVNASTALTARNGVLTIPITVDGQTFTKTFSFTLALKGEVGAKGDNAQLITLTSSGQIFTNPKTGSITPTTITVTGTAQNTTIATWQYSVNGGSFTTTLPTGVARSGNTVTLTGANITAKTIAIKALNGSIEDVITIAKVEDGIDGEKGDTGDSGLSIMLLNESQSISTTSARAVAPVQTINIPFTAYLGSTRIASTASLGTLPTGITVASITDGTATQDGVIVLTVANGANLGGTTTAFDTGTIEINITANNNTVSKPFSYSKSVAGTAGTTARTFFVEPEVSVITRGKDGKYTPSSLLFSSYYKDGTTASKTVYTRYWKIETTTDGVTWTELDRQITLSATYTVSTIPDGIVGIRATTYSNTTLTTAHDTQSVMIVSDGFDGLDGNNGVGITSVDVEYYLSTSSTTQTGGSWDTKAPTWIDGRFVWSRTKTTYTVGSPTTSSAVCITGGKGSSGATGKGILSITEEYAMSTSKTVVPAESIWNTVQPTWSKGQYIWTRSKIVYTNPSSTDYTTPYVDTSWEAVNLLEASVNNIIGNLDTSLNTLKNTTIPSLEDGLLNKSEKEAVRQSLNVTKSDKSGIDAQYTAVYGNSSLIGTPKTNLYNAKVAYNTAYGNLEVSINAVLNVADGTRITTTQFNAVQTNFTNYQNALSTLRQRFEEALDAISGKKLENIELELNKKTYLPVRYIRDWANGSSANTSNHWYEIQAYVNGQNVAQGKPVTSNTTLTNGAKVTDGLTSGTHASTSAGRYYVQIDLGKIYYDVDSVGVWRYHNDNRIYRDTKTEVSPDGTTWYTIFDSYNEGEYSETVAGKIHPNTYSKHEALTASASRIRQLSNEIDLSVKSGNVINSINVSEEGVRLKGDRIQIDGDTHFNDDVVMSNGVIRSKDGTTRLDLNNNTFTFDKPFTIGSSTVGTKNDIIKEVEDAIQNIEIGGRNLLNDTSSEWEHLTLDTGQTITYVHPEAQLEQDSTYTFTVEYETNDALIDVQVGTGLLGYEKNIIGWNATNIPSNQRVSLTHKVLESDLIKSTNTDSISIDDDFYLDSAMIVSNQSNALYSANGMSNPPVGGVFNNIQRDGVIPANRRKIDFPPLHNTIIVLLDYYNMTKDMRYLDKAKLIANYILTLEFEANFAGQKITLVAGNNVWNGTTWVLGTSEIGMRIVYNAINVMTLMYEQTKDVRYSALAKKLMITTTTAYGNVKNRISWGELGSYMIGAPYDQIYVNPDNNNASFSWAKFNQNNADALVETYHNYIRVFKDTEVTTVENDRIQPSVVVDDFAKWIIAINARGELTMAPTGLPYIFYDYPAGGLNWDWVSGDNTRGDVWFTGDATLWIIKGLSLLANDYPQLKQLAGTYFNNLYKLKATTHPTRGNLADQILFYDRYNFDGTRLADDMALSISSTALFWEVGQNINLITPKLEIDLINTLKVNYPVRTGNRNVDGAYSWDSVHPQDSLIEVKANGEIYHTLLAFYFAKSGSRNMFAYKITNKGTKSTIRYRRQQLEHGNIPTDWTEAPEDTRAKIDEKADTDLIDNIQEQLDDFVLIEDYDPQIGAINQALQDYRELIESGEVATDEAVEDIKKLLDRTVAIENNLGEFTESWNFEVTEITMGEEGLFLGDNLTNMGIRIAPQVGDTPPRIDFVDNGTVVAEITGQYMRINRGIFVQSAQIGEHQIETIAGGHTIWQWIPSIP